MSSESSLDQNASGTAGGSSRAAEQRTGQHLIGVAVFGGSRSSDKRAGVVHGVGIGRGVVWFAVIALVLTAWPVYKGGIIKPGSGLGYYFGYAGGVMMLLMLLYPLRKHAKWARNWGALRYWFMLHMLFGIGGPVLVLFHSTFHIKSFNAGVAFFSMLLVALSGIVGRFLYKRIHHGLYGRKLNMEELQKAVDSTQEKVGKADTVLTGAPAISKKLKQFREMAFTKENSLPLGAWKFMTLGWNRRKLAAHCRHELQRAVTYLANAQNWNKKQQDQYLQEISLEVSDYLSAVQAAAQFSAYERLFRLWHILHTPFVWLLGISGIVHVIAVNMY